MYDSYTVRKQHQLEQFCTFGDVGLPISFPYPDYILLTYCHVQLRNKVAGWLLCMGCKVALVQNFDSHQFHWFCQ